MFGLNPISFYIIVGLICTNLFAGGMWWLNSVESEAYQTKLETCQGKHQTFKDKVETAGNDAVAAAKQKEKESAKLAKDTSDGWSAAITAVRADYAKRVRDSARRSAGSGAVPQTAADRPGIAVPEPDAIPSPARIAQDCAETTVTLNFLQEYVELLQRLSP